MARPQKIMRISKRKSVFEADNDDFTLTLYNLNYGTNVQAGENFFFGK